MKLLPKEGTSGKKVPMLLLLAACVIEFLFITLENQFYGVGYYLAETYLIVPCLLFLGYMLREKRSRFATKRLLLALVAISWFFIVQIIHRLSNMGNHPMATVVFIYLMAFPFASLTDDDKHTGLRIVGSMFVAGSLVLVAYTLLLMLDWVPAGLTDYLFWDGARLHPLWHPNVVAGYWMIGIGFSLVFCIQTRKKLTKAALIAAIVMQLLAMAMTNCRTTILLTGAILGGSLFFLIFKGGWKRFTLGLLAAAVVLAGSFKLSGTIYLWNNDRLIASLSTTQENTVTEAEIPLEDMTQTEAAPIEAASTVETYAEERSESQFFVEEDTDILLGDNSQNSLLTDLLSFNGRTDIWSAALSALRDSKPLLLWGTEFSGTVISVYHWYGVDHAHNAWLETLMRMGVPGFLISLVFTVLSLVCAAKLILTAGTELWKKIIAMMTMCVMASGFLEPYLFITNVYYHITDFTFFFLTGYLDYWCSQSRKQRQ